MLIAQIVSNRQEETTYNISYHMLYPINTTLTGES